MMWHELFLGFMMHWKITKQIINWLWLKLKVVMVEVEGKIAKKSFSILIDLGSSHGMLLLRLLKFVPLRSASIVSHG